LLEAQFARIYFRFEKLVLYDPMFCFAFSKEKTCYRKKQVSPDLISPQSIYVHMCTLYYTHIRIHICWDSDHLDYSGPPSVLSCLPTPGLISSRAPHEQCVRLCVYTHLRPRAHAPASKVERHKTTLLSLLLFKITLHAKRQVLCAGGWGRQLRRGALGAKQRGIVRHTKVPSVAWGCGLAPGLQCAYKTLASQMWGSGLGIQKIHSSPTAFLPNGNC